MIERRRARRGQADEGREQCEEVEANWTYAGGMARVVRSMRGLVQTEDIAS